MMAQRLQTLEVGNHVIAVYTTKEEKYNEAFAFLKEGLQRNEVIVFTTTDLPKNEIRARMRNEWKVDVLELESKGDIIIRSLCSTIEIVGMRNEAIIYPA